MMPTYTAPTRINRKVKREYSAFTLTELIIVVVIVSLFLLLAVSNIFALLGKNTFRAQVQQFVSAMQMAASAAAESDRRYEVIIDLTEQSYLLRQITSPDLKQVLEEEVTENCQGDYGLFDDGDYSKEGWSYTNEGRAMFRAGHAGWQYGGKIVLLDEAGQPYSVVINRLNRIVTLEEGDVEILKPKAVEDVVF
jgi:prepilin-type N-terminal cleavage/methylation domain-containing protein